MSTDVRELLPQQITHYREYLTALRPFSSTPVFTSLGDTAEAFSTQLDGVTYLGILNRSELEQTVEINLASHRVTGTAWVYDPETDESTITEGSLWRGLPGRSFRLLVLRNTPGVLWAERTWIETTSGASS